MRIIKNGINERYIVYKLYDDVNEKIYIGKTTIPIYMRINSHRHGTLQADKYFSQIGWDKVTFEIIDFSLDKENLLKKESNYILKYYTMYKEKLLNINSKMISNFIHFPTEFKKLAHNYFEV